MPFQQPSVRVRFDSGKGMAQLRRLQAADSRMGRAVQQANEKMATDVQGFAYEALVAGMNPLRAAGRYNDSRGLRKALKDPKMHSATETGWTLLNARRLADFTRSRRIGDFPTTPSNPNKYWRAIEYGNQPQRIHGLLVTSTGELTVGPRPQPDDEYALRGRALTNRLNRLSSPNVSTFDKRGALQRSFVRSGEPYSTWNGRKESTAAGVIKASRTDHDAFWFTTKGSEGIHFMGKAIQRFQHIGAGRYYQAAFQSAGLGDFYRQYAGVTGRRNRVGGVQSE